MHNKLLMMIIFLLAATPAIAADEINPVVGRVGDFTIRETDLDRLIAGQPPLAQKQLADKPELKTAMVRELLLKKAIANKARKEGYDRKPEYRERLSYLIDDFLANEYLTKVVLADSRISDEEMRKYYKENPKEFQLSETVKARHIFIQLPATATAEEKAKAQAKAAAILVRLQKGEDFAKVAAEVSEDADSAKKGGELGVLTPGKTNSEEFEKAAFALKSGDISAIVESPFGLHIIKADEKSEKRTASFEESRDYIADKLKKERDRKTVEEFIAKTVKESGIELPGEQGATSGGMPASAPGK
jgi:peptidyl-prolyl cis-trans isomerase C